MPICGNRQNQCIHLWNIDLNARSSKFSKFSTQTVQTEQTILLYFEVVGMGFSEIKWALPDWLK